MAKNPMKIPLPVSTQKIYQELAKLSGVKFSDVIAVILAIHAVSFRIKK